MSNSDRVGRGRALAGSNKSDQTLGMDQAISRRDFVNGFAVAGALTTLASAAAAAAQGVGGTGAAPSPDRYPPLRNGYRGDYPGIYNPAHALRDGGAPPEGESTGEIYDLVVVGGGLSGISAAWYYRERAGNAARILIIENHDDFGGHAKRNEFVADGKMYVASGGSDRLPSLDTFAHDSARLIAHLGIKLGDPRDKTDTALFRSLGMEPSTFFNKQAYGKDILIKGGTLQRPTEEFLKRAPIPQQHKADLLRLMLDTPVDYMAGMTEEQKVAKLQSISYRDYLLNYVKVNPEIITYTMGVWALSNSTASAWFAMFHNKPGFAGIGVKSSDIAPSTPRRAATNYYFPSGNHSVARLILRDLIPDSLPPGDFIEAETQRFDYSTLDRPGQSVRVRLNSTVVRVKHTGANPRLFDGDKREVEVTYVDHEGRGRKVVGKDVIMAGNNNLIPYLCPELPEAQKAALHQAVRTINVKINVLLRNWTPFAKLGVSSVAFPKAFINGLSISAPRTFGSLAGSRDPSQPIVAGFNITNGVGNETFMREILGGELPPPGTNARDEARMARTGLYQLPFERIERAVRSQAAAALQGGGFDPRKDILAMTINRWGHGYALPVNTLFDDLSAPLPFVVGRQPFGRIAIANSDASGVDTIETAFNEAARAVRDIERHESGRNAVV